MGVLSQVLAAHLTGGIREAQAMRAMERNQGLLQGLMGQAGTGAYGPSGVHPSQAHLLEPPGTPGAGLMADPWDQTRQLQFAAGLMASPELAGVGGSIFNQVLSQNGMDRRLDLQQDLQRSQFDMAEAGRESRFQRELSQRRELHGETLGSREMLALLQRQQDQARAEAEAAGAHLGSIPSGYSRSLYQDPTTGQQFAVDTPNPGHKDHNAAVAKMQGGQTAIGIVDELIGLVSSSGKEAWGAKAGRMRQLHGQLISSIGQLRGLGVLEAGEYARMEEQLTNPGEAGFTSKATILEQLATVRGLFGRDYDNDRRRFRWYSGMGDLLGWDMGAAGSTNVPPGTEELSEAEAAQLGPRPGTTVTGTPAGPGQAPPPMPSRATGGTASLQDLQGFMGR